jgi:hypothetical protein
VSVQTGSQPVQRRAPRCRPRLAWMVVGESSLLSVKSETAARWRCRPETTCGFPRPTRVR